MPSTWLSRRAAPVGLGTAVLLQVTAASNLCFEGIVALHPDEVRGAGGRMPAGRRAVEGQHRLPSRSPEGELQNPWSGGFRQGEGLEKRDVGPRGGSACRVLPLMGWWCGSSCLVRGLAGFLCVSEVSALILGGDKREGAAPGSAAASLLHYGVCDMRDLGWKHPSQWLVSTAGRTQLCSPDRGCPQPSQLSAPVQ